MSQVSGDKAKIDSSKQLSHRAQPSVDSETLDGSGLGGVAAEMLQRLGTGFTQATFGRHADLLGDPKMSRPMYAGRRAAIMRQLQQDYGNRYVRRLVKHISNKKANSIQTKLKVGPAGDKYEQEADRVAKHIVDGISSPGQDATRRQVPEEEELQMKPTVQRQIGLEGGEVEPGVEASIRRAGGSGSPLPGKLRRSMEGAFSADFSGVKVHTGTEPDALNDSMGGRAFTTGKDIFVRRADYNPGTRPGRELLAHELTHVVQQEGDGIKRGLAGDRHENDELKMNQPSAELIRRQEEDEETSDSDIGAEIQATYGAQQITVSTAFEIPSDSIDVSGPASSGKGVKTILKPGANPQTFLELHESVGDLESTAHASVAPGGGPTIGAAGNDCTPDVAGSVLDWEVVSVDGSNWGAKVKSLTLAGQLNVKPWPSKPSQMVVPNTANPVKGGNINNTANSDNNWQAAIDDMADYDVIGGGAGPNWHSTDASSGHEWAHWNQDYIADSVNSGAGGNWPQTNIDLDALREPKASSTTVGAARIALEAKVNARMKTWRRATIKRWNTLITTTDKPGKGGRGYAAGMAKLNTLIGNIRSFKNSEGW